MKNPSPDLIGLREEVFSQIRSNHHYFERREVVDMVSEEALRQDHSDIITSYGVDWHRKPPSVNGSALLRSVSG